LGAISTYVDEYPATKWDYERLTVYFHTGNWSMAKISEMVSTTWKRLPKTRKTIYHSIIPPRNYDLSAPEWGKEPISIEV